MNGPLHTAPPDITCLAGLAGESIDAKLGKTMRLDLWDRAGGHCLNRLWIGRRGTSCITRYTSWQTDAH
jgi:hypothetical protein